MKYIVPSLILASSALAASLAACGGSDPATPPTRLAANMTAVPGTAQLAGFSTQRPAADDPGDAPPGRVPPPEATPPGGPLLELVIENEQAKVCQRKSRALQVCAAVEAPLPPATRVELWYLPDGVTALTYARAPFMPDPTGGSAAVQFQAAFNGAARAVLAYPSSNLRAPGQQANGMVCDNEDCVEDTDIPVVDVPGTRGGGGGGGGGGGDGGGGGGGGGSDSSNDGAIQTVIIRGVPEPVSSLPVVVVTGAYDPSVPLLPPRNKDEDLAELSSPCVVSPIMTVCIRGKRPPVAGEPQLPSGKMPWFPQSWCDWSHVFCSDGQEQRDSERVPGSETSGKTLDELYDICDANDAVNVGVCNANRPGMDSRSYRACLERATSKLAACRQTARRLTDNGAHVAP